MSTTTNKVIKPGDKLAVAGRNLLDAANEYWKLYQKELGSAAVVWLENTHGHFVLFTRSEYKDAIVRAATRETVNATAMFEPFEEGC